MQRMEDPMLQRVDLKTSTAEFKPPPANGSTAVNVPMRRQKTAEIEKEIDRHILAIKTAEPNNWEAIVKARCGISRSRAYELMAIAEGVKTTEQCRRETNARKIKYRAEQAVRSGTDK